MLAKLRIVAQSLDDAQQARAYVLRTLGDSVELTPPKSGRDGTYVLYGTLHLPDEDDADGWALDLSGTTEVRR
jgi:hypothetical protein